MNLRELSRLTQTSRSPRTVLHIFERELFNTVWRFVKNERARDIRKCSQLFASVHSSLRAETPGKEIHPTADPKPRGRSPPRSVRESQRREFRAAGKAHKAIARIGNRRCPGVRNERNIRVAGEFLRRVLRLSFLH